MEALEAIGVGSKGKRQFKDERICTTLNDVDKNERETSAVKLLGTQK
jgi:hypothetical protein